jgi:hypothetical protein
MAFLQRVTNGEGRIERAYSTGRGREKRGSWDERLFWDRQGDVTVLGC